MNDGKLFTVEDMGKHSIARNRIIYEGAIFHVTQRAPGKEIIFLESDDYLRFLKHLKATTKEFRIRIFSFALLQNHLHLLLQIESKNLSEGMKFLFESYAKYFNKKYVRKGHVFCGRFRALLCRDDAHMLAASLYIHLNPVMAGLCQDPVLYRWSSLGVFANEHCASFIVSKNVWDMLDSDMGRARQQYFRLLEQGALLKQSGHLAPKMMLRHVFQLKQLVQNVCTGGDNNLENQIVALKEKKRLKRPSDLKSRRYIIAQMRGGGYTDEEIQKVLGIGRRTLYRALRLVG